MNPNEPQAPVGYKHFHAVAMIFVASLLVSNTIAVKIISAWGFTLPAGIIVFPIAYIFGDVLTEVYGFRKSRSIIWWGFFCLAGMSFLYWLASVLPPAPFWKEQDKPFAQFFGFTPRIAVSSFIAYLVGEFLNSVVMSRLKIKTQGRHLWFRAVTSTIIGEGADSLVFNLCAFTGVFPIGTVFFIAFSGFVLKCLYEVVALPMTYVICAWLKRSEGIDTYDRGVSYTPFKIT